MKSYLAHVAAISFCVSSCEMISSPLDSDDSFDPLRTPGSNLSSASSEARFKGGEFVSAVMDNTGFYQKKPKGDAQADKLLNRGTQMKVVSHSGSFVKVELDGGEIGFVPAVMLETPGAAVANNPLFAADGTQVFPPLDGSFAAPIPPLPAGALPPDGVIPTVIDPENPSGGPVPAITPTTDTFPVPPSNPNAGSAPAPLPPNEEDLERMKKEGTSGGGAPPPAGDTPKENP
ncbi:MAG: hypothetical protein V4733_07610 [Verrucomicrobiota bacterium]